MLLQIGIGDAYGAGFEFSPMEKIQNYNDLTSYHTHELDIPAGHYTDDTQMSLALAELLIDGESWSRELIADKFVACFKRDVREGYSKGFFQLLSSIENGTELIARIDPKSTRNGAAMRAAPIGVVSDIEAVLSMAEMQASITHNTEIGIKSAQAVALTAHYFIYDKGPKSALGKFVSEFTKRDWNDSWNAPVACCGEETVNALLTVLKNSSTLKEVLINSVAFSGDVDTVAAVGLGIANLSVEYEKSLLPFLYDELENGIYGRDYLQGVGEKLLSLRVAA